MCRAFELAGANVSLVHLDRLVATPGQLEGFDLIGFPGGFSYGDDIASGRIFAMRLRERLFPALRDAARRGVPMIGACNGFQVLVQVGLLPGPGAGMDWPADAAPPQTCALSHNAGGRFVDRWCRVAANPGSVCVWTQGLNERWPMDDGDGRNGSADVMMLPIAHGEGRFVCDSPATIDSLIAGNQVALTYLENPNGSSADIAGICDATGRIFGLMPHPERYLDWTNHPFWTRLDDTITRGVTPGLLMFQNAVEAARHARV
jgi:phosphoribosylformylglycinamidine synthase